MVDFSSKKTEKSRRYEGTAFTLDSSYDMTDIVSPLETKNSHALWANPISLSCRTGMGKGKLCEIPTSTAAFHEDGFAGGCCTWHRHGKRWTSMPYKSAQFSGCPQYTQWWNAAVANSFWASVKVLRRFGKELTVTGSHGDGLPLLLVVFSSSWSGVSAI